jgi:hypothetical protein
MPQDGKANMPEQESYACYLGHSFALVAELSVMVLDH